jgi:hypothetical protein
MSTQDELRELFGEDFFDRKDARESRQNWHELCVCGHIDRLHAVGIGGRYVTAEPKTVMLQGEEWTHLVVFGGCIGAMRLRNYEENATVSDHERRITTLTIRPTCPCDRFRKVAKVDRPNRYFNQRLPRDLTDQSRHPFQLGIRAFSTHLSKRRAALSDPSWATAEFARRFEWLPSERVCGISKCTTVDGVFPVFVHDDRSELRCPAHR